MNQLLKNIPKLASEATPYMRPMSVLSCRETITRTPSLFNSLAVLPCNAATRSAGLSEWNKNSSFSNRMYSSQKEEDTHDDFKPVSHAVSSPDVKTYIEQCVTDNKVFLFMKGNPSQPMCGFSMTAVKILKHYQVSFGAADVLLDPELREGIKEYSKWPTIPQLYVDKEFVGGSDILLSMHESGELKEVLGVADNKE